MNTTGDLAGTFDLHSEDRELFELLLEQAEDAQNLESPLRVTRSSRSQAPLSFAQRRLWFLRELEPDSPAYNMPGAVRLSGSLSHPALWNSLAEIIRRHESLRTAFANVDGEGMQVIASADDFNNTSGRQLPHLVDLSGLDTAHGAVTFVRLTSEQARRPFDLSKAPALRTALVRSSKYEHALLITMHHIVSDEWSVTLLMGELGSLYGRFSSGEPSTLDELAIQYRYYALWQREWFRGPVLEEQLCYWQRQLEGQPANLELPTDYPRPSVLGYRGAAGYRDLDEDLSGALRELARQQRVTLFMLLLAAFQVLLYRHTGEKDVVAGTPISGRNRIEIEGLIGFFVNTLVIRTGLSGDPGFDELLRRTKETVLGAFAHQDLPFELLVEKLRPDRNLSGSPLFNVSFSFESATPASLDLGDAVAEIIESENAASKFDLALSTCDSGRSIAVKADYRTELFFASTIERLLAHFEILLRGIVAKVGARINELPLLTASEITQLVFDWNDASAGFTADQCVQELFEEQVLKTPDAVAVVFRDESLSYDQLNRRANQLAHYLTHLGVTPDARVAICVERGLEIVVGLLAVLKAGGVYVPLDPAYPPDRLRFMLEDSDPVALLTQSHLERLFPQLRVTVPVLDLNKGDALWKDLPDTNPDPDSMGLTPNHLAYIIYTSGSTGTPKGVMVEHANVARLFTATDGWFKFDDNDVWTLFHSYAFDFSVWEIWGALLYGGRLIVVPREIARLPDEFYELVCQEKVTILNQTPSAFRQLIAAQSNSRGLHRLRYVVFGGEALEVTTLKPWYQQNPNQNTRLINMYGITETTVHVTYRQMEQADSDRRGGSPIGCRIPDLRTYILDGHGQPAPIGVAGELYIGGAGVARGYLNRPDLTAERFVKDPYSAEPGARMYKTGDLGRWLADGDIEFVGRNDFQVKLRGFRIELGEIESRLAECPDVREAVVMAHEDTSGAKRLVAYYTTSLIGDLQQGPLSAERLRSHLSGSLPEYMVPAAYVRLESLPLTPNGKLDRKALAALEADAWSRGGYEPPQGEIETNLAAIWADVLKLDRVGRHDNFFSLGGHSLLAVTLIERIRRYGFIVDVRTLFATPTLADLAVAVDAATSAIEVPPNLIAAGCESITPELLPLVQLTQAEIDGIIASVPGGAANVQDIYPLAPLQEGIFFHHLMGGEGDPYLLSGLFAAQTRERLDVFLGALQAVVDRHDILRTALAWEGLAEPVQVVWRKAPMAVEEVGLDPDMDATTQLLERFDPRHHRLDLRRAPMFRVCVAFDAIHQRWLLLTRWHHLIGDHTTLDAVHREIQAGLQGRADLPPASTPYRNLVAQARLGISRQEHESFFQQMLGDVDEPTAPFGLLDVWGDGSGIREAWLPVDAGLSRRIRQCARRLGASPATLAHHAWAQVLSRLTGRRDVVFGTVLFGRMQGGEGSDRGIGLFINTLPVRIPIGAEGVEANVRRTQVLLADLLRHEHASLALAQRCSLVPAPAPLFTTLLNYRHSAADDPPASAGALEGWEGIENLRGEERTNYPLTLSVDDLGEGFVLTAQVQAPMAAERTCALMHRALESLADALERAPETPARSLEVLPESERRLVLYEWNDTNAEFPADQCVHELFQEQALKTPDALAVVSDDESLSYGELKRRANLLAHYLRELGVRPGETVAIILERSFGLVAAELAILKAGSAYVPLDASFPPERLAFIIQDCGAKILITTGEVRCPYPDGVVRIDLDGLDLEGSAEDLPLVTASSVEAAYVMYTSGSTGMPKGVVVTHRAILRLIVNNGYAAFEAGDRVAFAANPAFDAATLEVWAPLLHGGGIVVIGQEDLLDPKRFGQALRGHGVNVLWLTVGLFNRYAEDLSEELGELRYLIVGGDAVDPRVVARTLSRKQPGHLLNGYGPTETTTFALTYEIRRVPAGAPSIPIGRPISNTQVYILDTCTEPVPIGVAGELYIGGAGVARGYLNRPELTAQRFVEDPFSAEPGARMYKTGDLGRWLADGNIEFLGRNDFQVKIRGFRIELGEIESRLVECPDVREAVVMVCEDSPGDKRLVAYYTTSLTSESKQGPLSAQRLRTHLSGSLPEYMVPSAYVRLESLPLTPNGKLDRKALAAPEGDAYARGGYEPPQGEIETALAAIWADVLKVDLVGRDDNFFSLGGHSLLATRAVSAIKDTFRAPLTLLDFFSNATIRSLALIIAIARREASGIDLPEIKRAAVRDNAPASWAQERLWFLDQLDPGSAANNIPAALRVEGALRRPLIEQALGQIARRHETLRTTFVREYEHLVQVVSGYSGIAVPLVDLGELDPDLREAVARDLLARAAIRPFNLSKGPLLKPCLLRLRPQEHVIIMVVHHIISDGWSMGLMTEELCELYNTYSHGGVSTLKELQIQYSDFAIWQREWLSGEILEEQLSFWRQQLAGAPELMNLPCDRPRPAAPSFRSGGVSWLGNGASFKETMPRHRGDFVHGAAGNFASVAFAIYRGPGCGRGFAHRESASP
jgi:arthrofactin-type cyclic lipopeptide synthetase C